MTENTSPLDVFGKLLMQKVRDIVFEEFLKILAGKIKSPTGTKLHQALAHLDSENQEILKYLTLDTIDSTIHHFLWMIEQGNVPPDEMDLIWKTPKGSVSLRDISGWLSSETFGEEGRIAKFSVYPEAFAEKNRCNRKV